MPSGLRERIEAMWRGDKINTTEDRAVLHVALRQPRERAIGGAEIEKHRHGRARADARVRRVGARRRIVGSTKKPFKLVVNIGIGGSDLGPAMAVLALEQFTARRPACEFVSNVDGCHLIDLLRVGGSGDHAVHRRLQDVRHSGDADQRAHRARVAEGEAGRGGGAARTSPRSRSTTRRWTSSACIRTIASRCGTGSAAAIRCGPPSACRSRSPSARRISCVPAPAGTRWTSISARTPWADNLPALMGLAGRLEHQLHGSAHARGAALRRSPEALSRPTCSSSRWRATASP